MIANQSTAFCDRSTVLGLIGADISATRCVEAFRDGADHVVSRCHVHRGKHPWCPAHVRYGRSPFFSYGFRAVEIVVLPRANDRFENIVAALSDLEGRSVQAIPLLDVRLARQPAVHNFTILASIRAGWIPALWLGCRNVRLHRDAASHRSVHAPTALAPIPTTTDGDTVWPPCRSRMNTAYRPPINHFPRLFFRYSNRRHDAATKGQHA